MPLRPRATSSQLNDTARPRAVTIATSSPGDRPATRNSACVTASRRHQRYR